MKTIVFTCHKCECEFRISDGDGLINEIEKLSNLCCPECGEEPYRNWLLAYVGEEEDE